MSSRLALVFKMSSRTVGAIERNPVLNNIKTIMVIINLGKIIFLKRGKDRGVYF